MALDQLVRRPQAAILRLAPVLLLLAACTQAPPAPPASSDRSAGGAPPAPATVGGAQPAPTTAAAAKPTVAAVGTPRRGGIARVGISQEPILLNTILGSQTVTNIVTETVVEGFLTGNPDGSYLPVLAEEVPSEDNGGVSADGTTITWKLKKGVTWSDGKPFTSKDALFTYRVYMDKSNPIPIRAGWSDIASVETPDDHTVVVHYSKLYAAFKEHFLRILPEHVLNGETAIEKKDYNRAPVGTGPFKFKSWTSGDNITLERNPNYRESGKPYLDGLIFKIVPSREASIQAFKVGEIDALWNLSESNIPEFQAMTDAVIEPTPSNRVERLVLNASCNSGPRQGDPECPHPVLGDLRVRQALEMAIDKKALVDKLLFGKTTVASSVIPLGWYAPTLPTSEYNPDKAKQLMEQAGWKPGSDGIRVKDGVRARLEFGTTTGDRLREQTQQVIQELLRGIGIEVEIKNSPSAVLLGNWQDNAPRARGNFDILMWTTNADLEPQRHLVSYFGGDQIPTDQSRSGRNYHRIIDPELDKAFELANSTSQQATRKAAYKTAAERINAGKGHVVLYNRLEIDGFKKHLKGHAVNVWDYMAWDTQNWWLDK
jgi:peptide/nickel transport system substrate-binding protein